MALFQCTFFSKYLAYDTQVNVILPEDRSSLPEKAEGKATYPVLYLLHGRGDNCTSWLRNSRIEQLACQHQIAVVMPSAEDSFYVDSVNGKRYFSYMTKELPALMQRWFPISSEPEHTFIAGLSMGGYGTLKLGLTEPERYAGIAFFSAATDPQQLYNLFDDPMDSSIINDNLNRVFGGLPFPAEYIPIELLKARIKEGCRIPPMIQFEGKQDMLYDMNQQFLQEAKQLGQSIHYEEWDGEHDWKFWDVAIERALNLLPIHK